jgi:hypothetical protein
MLRSPARMPVGLFDDDAAVEGCLELFGGVPDPVESRGVGHRTGGDVGEESGRSDLLV